MTGVSGLAGRSLRAIAIAGGIIALWQVVVLATGAEHYILPSPLRVAAAMVERHDVLLRNAIPTLAEIVIGLLAGTGLGAAAALVLASTAVARRWVLPILVVSQAVPVFALAPLLVIWLGYGMASKIAMATLIIFFPVTSAFLDGLRRTPHGWLDLASVMGASRSSVLWHIRVPSALPALASGMRIAAAVAPIGAVVGEWVGSAEGLGFLMLHANARLQIDLMFAALTLLSIMALVVWFATDWLARQLVPWQSADPSQAHHR